MKSSEWWMHRFTAMAAVGLALILVGRAFGHPSLVIVGRALCAPLFIAQALLLTVGLPVALWLRWRERRRDHSSSSD